MILDNLITKRHDCFVTKDDFSDGFFRPFDAMSLQDTASGVALWRQVADGIERGIADGRFAAGDRLPGETEIAETYRVNRHTVRAERGSGTYVEAPRLAYPLRSRTRFSEIVGAGGREPDGRLIDASQELASRELARLLGLKTGAPLIRIEALRLADRTPICVGTIWLGAERFPDAGRIYERMRSMTKLLAHYGVRDYRRASTRVTAAIVDATDAARLDLALGRPVLVVDSTDVDAEGTPLATKHTRFAAERIEFVVENS